ncbi:AraC-like ligand-binding domain-containing protein [Nocardia sp. MW-W600-9]
MTADVPAAVDCSRLPGVLAVGAHVRAEEQFQQWEAMLTQTYLPLAARPAGAESFHGRIAHHAYPDFGLSRLTSTRQEVTRTRSLIARAAAEYLLISIHTRGSAVLSQHGRSTRVGVGEMVFYESNAPYEWRVGEDIEQVIVQIPMDAVRRRPGMSTVSVPTARTIPADGPVAIVSGFLTDLARLQDRDTGQAAALTETAIDLIASAASLVAGKPVNGPAENSLTREGVLAYLRANYTDPALTIDSLAAACFVSRRSVYRVFEEHGESPSDLLRRLRVRRACAMLVSRPDLTFGIIGAASGFATERQFYRAFRRETGRTPGAYRRFGTDGQSSGTV